jgi:hypothetical protein
MSKDDESGLPGVLIIFVVVVAAVIGGYLFMTKRHQEMQLAMAERDALEAANQAMREGAADDKAGVTEEGFLQKWLVLAPIPLAENEGGADALGQEQLKDEANLKPKVGDKVQVGDKQLNWKEHVCKDYLLDFNAFLGATTEDSVAYAVTFIEAAEEINGVKMKTGSDDEVKIYLNGKEVFKFDEGRSTERDEDSTEVTLQKGVNVLVVKVINEKEDWSFCVRFTDKDDKPLANLKSRTSE